MKEIIKKSIVWWVTFFFTVLFLTIWYAAVVNIWTNTSELEVNTNSTLSADKWNKLLWNFEFLKSKTENIYSSWGNVGIWVNPSNWKFSVWLGENKNIRFNTDTSWLTNEPRISSTNDAVTESRPLWVNWSYFWIQTNGSERVRVDSIWNVWIWTYNPTEKLDIYWNISFWAYWDDRKFLLRNIIAANWTTCSIACWTSYCLWAYTDLTKIKQTCSDTLNNKNCICIWK